MAAVVAACVEDLANNSHKTTLEKIESFLNETSYNEALENSSNYNTRLCIERRLRLPFIDTQTGVAQNPSQLFLNKRQRIPGILPGQIYSYPRQRWRKKRRQYLSMNSRGLGRAGDHMFDESDLHNLSQNDNPGSQDTDSKDSQLLKDDVSKEWFYDEADMLEMDTYDEPDQDSDLDYEESYSKRKRGRKPSGRGRSVTDSPNTPGRRKGAGRGRKKSSHNFEPTPGDPDKPFACELCGARYKTRPGLTYHYRHSHKEGASDENSRDSIAATPSTPLSSMNSMLPGSPQNNLGSIPTGQITVGSGPPLLTGLGDSNSSTSSRNDQVYQDSYVSFLNQNPGPHNRRMGRQSNSLPGQQMQIPSISGGQIPPTLPPNLPSRQPSPMMEEPQMPVLLPEKSLDTHIVPAAEPPVASPGPLIIPEGLKKNSSTPFCEFCLGNSSENRKTGLNEELVTCSECGRSGHPSCLQFTDNIRISVKTYRWQCIDCKCCSVCGSSENEQLLFCDDCDRGYHMSCLSPPLVNAPEGSWSCKVCVSKFP